MASTEVSTNEHVLIEGRAATIRTGIWERGTGFLTPQHFYRQLKGYGLLPMTLGILGRFINGLFPVRTDIDIPLSSITVVGRGKLGLLNDVLYIETNDGKSYQIAVEFDKWLSPFQEALQKYSNATLVPSGDQKWQVQR